MVLVLYLVKERGGSKETVVYIKTGRLWEIWAIQSLRVVETIVETMSELMSCENREGFTRVVHLCLPLSPRCVSTLLLYRGVQLREGSV